MSERKGRWSSNSGTGKNELLVLRNKIRLALVLTLAVITS